MKNNTQNPHFSYHQQTYIIPEFSSRVPTSVRISRQDFELSSFPEKLLTVSSNEASFLEEEMERKKCKQMSANKNNKNGDNNGDDGSNSNSNSNSSDNNRSKSNEMDKEKEKEKDKRSYTMEDCVLSSSIMHMWGYPLPPTLPSTSSTTSITTLKSESLPQTSNSFGDDISEKRSRDENTDSQNGNIPKKVRNEISEETETSLNNTGKEESDINQENIDGRNTVIKSVIADGKEKEKEKGSEDLKLNNNVIMNQVEVEVVWSDVTPIGATVGYVPSLRETKNIFSLRVSAQGEGEEIGGGIESLGSVGLKCATVDSAHSVQVEGGGGVGGEGGVTDAGGGILDTHALPYPLPPLPLPLVYPSFDPLIQSTRGPNSGGPGVNGYRETVSQYSEKFKTLWMSPSICPVNART